VLVLALLLRQARSALRSKHGRRRKRRSQKKPGSMGIVLLEPP
jgi:hypothetical protein